jgi:predicted GNAT family N-acyltransferase
MQRRNAVISLYISVFAHLSEGFCFLAPHNVIQKVYHHHHLSFSSHTCCKPGSSLGVLEMSTSEGNDVKVIGTTADLHEALLIRRKVFIDEQNVPECEEIDEFDQTPNSAIHFLARRDGKPVATARVRLIDDGTRAKIQRVATLAEFRQQGIGHALMSSIVSHIRANHRPPVQELYLEAQVHAILFYEKLGFKPFGEEFLDVGIPHRAMRLDA